MNIAVAGTGYVGMSIATLLAQNNHVTAVDVIPEKVEKINNRISPIQDDYIEKYLAEKELELTATLDGAAAYRDADFVVIAAPTNYDPVKNYFDTHCIEDVIDLVLEVNPEAVMVIKSTIPVGYCRSLYVKYAAKGVRHFNLLFFPEFLRESKALYDNLYPSRIIAGIPKIIDRPEFAEENAAIRAVTDVDMLTEKARQFTTLLQDGVWTVARATRICSLHRIMSALLSCSGVSAFVSDASRYSVWPGKLNPGLCIECLSIGAVTRTSIAPSRKSVTAASRAAKAAAPAASDSCPGSILRSSPTTLTILKAPSRASDALSALLRLTCGSSMALR